MAVTAFVANIILLLILWIWYRRNKDKTAVEIAKKRYPNQNPRRMGMLSELWHVMYAQNNGPTIHAFEHGELSKSITHDPFESAVEFWKHICAKYINFRSVPTKIQNRWFWIEKKEYDPTKQVRKIQLASKDKLTEFLNSKLDTPFDKNLPFWEAYFIRFDNEPTEVYTSASINTHTHLFSVNPHTVDCLCQIASCFG